MMLVSALMAAFLDALSVAAVVVSVCTGVLGVYYHVVENANLPLLEGLHHETMSYELVPHAPSKAFRHKTEEEVMDILEHPERFVTQRVHKSTHTRARTKHTPDIAPHNNFMHTIQVQRRVQAGDGEGFID